ncbi:formin-like protein 2 isoform X2 [Henckelia pumila]|uniref:formin-like protein 2 isoform X2 n=1 Tax=Henckelia pumila TaxID=405737 RepID=UPI003C6DE244
MLHLYLPAVALFSTLLTLTVTAASNRRLLHQPLFPVDQVLPPTAAATTSQPPSPSPQPPLKDPFSTLYPPDTASQNPFFPVYYSPPPPPPPPPSTATAFPTFPANISSLVLPSSSSPTSHKPIKLIFLILSISLLSVVVLSTFLVLRRYCHHRHNQRTDKRPLFPPNTTPSDTSATKNPPPLPRYTASSNSSEFLYLGTLVSSRDANGSSTSQLNEKKSPPLAAASLNYQRIGSPELHPLPPLPREHSNRVYDNTHLSSSSEGEENDNGSEKEAFFSPGGSTGAAFPHVNTFDNNGNDFKGRIFNSTNENSSRNSLSSVGSPSVVLNSCSPLSIESKSPDSLISFPPALPRFVPPPPARQPRVFSAISPSDGHTTNCSPDSPGVEYVPSPPQAPPPPQSVPHPQGNGPPELLAPSRKVVQMADEGKRSSMNLEGGNEENVKPKLKPLHWDKVRTSSDRTMVWDQMKSSSFQLNEEMIETLFPANSSNVNAKNTVRCQIFPDTKQEESMVLDPKKSQNIAILLRALNVTVDEVCEALVEGNADTLGTELLESLLRMAPTKEEEQKLKDLAEESPIKLGTAETFLKAMLDIPFAFKRVDAMLYTSACKELKSSRMFRKLLEAVLKTGNRMNVGTNRGNAHAFNLHALLKLVDVKGADGKTTLLHFVVQEIIRTEGARLSEPEKGQQPTLRDEVEFRKIGLQVVSGLSGELTNAKKVASMDANMLSNDVAKLVNGVSKITQVLKLHEEVALKDDTRKFSCHMNEFLIKAESEIARIQAQEGIALSMVKGLTEFFHGDSAKEDARSFWLFVIVRDFLSILDQVCKDVGKINERSMVNSNSGSQIQIPANPCLPRVFPGLNGSPEYSSSDEETSSST